MDPFLEDLFFRRIYFFAGSIFSYRFFEDSFLNFFAGSIFLYRFFIGSLNGLWVIGLNIMYNNKNSQYHIREYPIYLNRSN